MSDLGYNPDLTSVGGSDYVGDTLSAASPNTPHFDVGSFLTGVTQDIAGFEKGLDSATVGHADKDLYQQYLDDFGQYSDTKKADYQTQEAQTLGDRLAAMGMRGIQTGGADQPTSGAAAYTAQKSIYDAGYDTLVNQLDLEKTSAEGKLNVANAQIQAGDVTMGASVGSAAGAVIGSIIPVIGTTIGGAIGAGVGALAGWVASWL